MPTREYYQRHKDRVKKRMKEYYNKNKERFRTYSKSPKRHLYEIEYKKRKRLAAALEKIKTLKGKKQQLQAMIRKHRPQAGLVRNAAQNPSLSGESIFSTGVTR